MYTCNCGRHHHTSRLLLWSVHWQNFLVTYNIVVINRMCTPHIVYLTDFFLYSPPPPPHTLFNSHSLSFLLLLHTPSVPAFMPLSLSLSLPHRMKKSSNGLSRRNHRKDKKWLMTVNKKMKLCNKTVAVRHSSSLDHSTLSRALLFVCSMYLVIYVFALLHCL